MHDANVEYAWNTPGVDAKLKNTKSIKMGPNGVATIKPIIMDTYNTFTFLESNDIKAKQKTSGWMQGGCATHVFSQRNILTSLINKVWSREAQKLH